VPTLPLPFPALFAPQEDSMTTTLVLDAVQFEAPPVNPAIPGLFAATDWQTDAGPARFVNGVVVRGPNYGGDNSSGVWDQPWCSVPDIDLPEVDRKAGERPEILDAFDPLTVWAYDECDLLRPTRREVEERAQQILRLEEQPMVERAFADRLLLDAGDLDAVPGLVERATLKEAVAYLEGEVAKTNTVGYLHIGAHLPALEEALFVKSGTSRTSPLGHVWIIGGGYVEGLGQTIVATSKPFGWRTAPITRTAIAERRNLFAAVAERTVTIGYEAVIAAVTITPAP
jgi:hypothetical protein